MKYSIDILVIEITRKCNLKCRHCLRGTAQNKSITQEMINQIVSKFDYISCVVFGGGEPSLHPEAIDWFCDAIKMYDVQVGNFYIVTNGKTYSDKLYNACYRLYNLCTKNEISGFTISDDEFHRECIVNRHKWNENFLKYAKYKYDNYLYDEDMSEELYYELDDENDYLPYFRPFDKKHKDNNFYGIIKMGNAEKNGIWEREKSIFYPTIKYYSDMLNIEDGELYVAYNGDIFPDCDLSYQVMNKGKYKLGNINNFDDVIIEIKKHRD